MTTTSLPRYPGRQRVTQARVMRSEWIKLRTQPSALWSLASAVVLIIVFGILYALLREARPPQGAAAIRSFDPVSVSLSGVELAQIATGVLGVLLITSEYATGLIRTTLAAVPRRLPVLWGKAAVVAAVTVVVTLPAALAAFLAGQEVLGRQHLATSLGHPGVAQALIGSSLYLAACGLLGLALGALLRGAAGGISALFGLFFALPIVAGFLPGSWSDDIGKYLPSTAGLAVTTVHPDPAASLAPWAGLGVFCLYAAVLLGFAALRTRRGDAKLRRGLPRWRWGGE
jgi:ABC-type transport system involved in multi-copper enzyme maturation permease subunit